MNRISFKRQGFTLIELLVVVAIIVILAALIIVNISEARMNGRDAKRIADVSSIQLALEMYKDKNGVYPPRSQVSFWAAATGGSTNEQTNWNWLADGNNNAPFGLKPYLSPLPKDPLNKIGYRYYVRINHSTASPVNPAEEQTGAVIKTKLEADTNSEKMKDDSCGDNGYYDVITGVISATQKTQYCTTDNTTLLGI